MKNIGIKTAVIAAVLAIVGWQAYGANVMSVLADESPALRVYNGATGTLTIVTSSAGLTNIVTVDGIATTLAGGSYDTIAELAAGIAACTNAAGAKKLTVDSDCSLAADSTDAELLVGTYTATAGKWLEMPWDTSTHLSYDLYLRSRTYAAVGAYRIKSIQGVSLGTGNLTLSVYEAGVLKTRKVVTSPVYVLTATNTVNAAVDVVNLNESVDIPELGSVGVLIRAARATTETDTGVLSAVIE